jgi:hypothetical protein
MLDEAPAPTTMSIDHNCENQTITNNQSSFSWNIKTSSGSEL